MLTVAHIAATEEVCLQIGDARKRILRNPVVSCMKIRSLLKQTYIPIDPKDQ
jgi:hypothetical protein